MTVLKGYPGQKKEERTSAQYVTVNPIGEGTYGLDTRSFTAVQEIGSDAAEADSTTILINATAHAAKVGDLIRMTSGATSGEVATVYSITTNSITLAQELSADPSALDTFTIERFRLPIVNSSGEYAVTTTPGPTSFTLDAATQVVTEDTGTPANNKPLPVKLVNATGDVDPATETTLAALNAKVTSINTGAVTVAASALPAGASTEATLSTLNGKVTAVDTGNVTIAASALPTGAATEATLAAQSAKITACNTGAVTVAVSALPAGAATEATLAAQSAKITACDTGAVTVAVSALPSGAATEATLSTLDGKVTTCNTGAVVVSSSALPSGAATEATLTALSAKLTERDVVDFMDTPLLIASTTTIPASASTPVTVVASLAADVKKLQFMDTTGAYIGVYSDPAGTPALECILGPGSDSTVECQLASTTVIGLRNMENAAITAGSLAINFIG